MSDFHFPECKQHRKPFWQILLSARWRFKQMLETGTWVWEQYVRATLSISVLSLFHLFLPKAIISLKAFFFYLSDRSKCSQLKYQSRSSQDRLAGTSWFGSNSKYFPGAISPLPLLGLRWGSVARSSLHLSSFPSWRQEWHLLFRTSPSHHDSTAMLRESYSLNVLQSWYLSIRHASPHILPRESAIFGERRWSSPFLREGLDFLILVC